MQLFQIHHGLSLSRVLHSSMWQFDASIWLHVFARSLVSVFIPIFLFNAGYSVGEVMVYYFIYNAIDVPLNFFARWLTRKIGARMVVIIGQIFMLLFFISLSLLVPDSWWYLVLVGFLAAMYDALYWVAHLYFFVECSTHKENISRDMSLLQIVKQIAAVIAPAIGAAILIFFSEDSLLFVSAGFVALSIIPLFGIRNIQDKPTGPQKKLKEFFHSWDTTRDYISVMFWGIHASVEQVIFPVFIFVLFSSIKSVAALPIIVAIASMLFTYFAGRIKKEQRARTIAIGATLIATIWILRLMLGNDIFYYVSVFFVGLFSVLVNVPLVSTVFEKGERIDGLSSSAYRNAASMFSKMILFGFLALFTNVFNISFVSAALALFLLMLFTLMFDRYSRFPQLGKV